ncbi:MAG: pyridine nucleotide-disulfide oxidoreductase/dicluster-binding protein [Anaerovoracaceae bacterium]|jgi:Fe-S oxidoreductase
MHRFYEEFEDCREHEIPFCRDACPFKMDFLDVQKKLVNHNYNAAYKTMRNGVVFPGIVAALCPAYCEQVCPRAGIDAPVQINLLEKTIVAKARRKKPNEYNLPAKEGKLAVIGGGISGLGFAFRMASKKYQVTVYEKTDKIGGHLEGLLPEETYMEEFRLQFLHEEYTLYLNTPVHALEELAQEGYDVIYVATGKGGEDFGLLKEDLPCKKIGKTAVFAGGSLRGKDTIPALAEGLDIARGAEIYLKTGALEYPLPGEASKVVANEDLLIKTTALKATDEDGTFTDEEAATEASRCIRCQCDPCRRECDLVDFYDKWPIAMRDEIILTSKPSNSMIHKNPARKYINACTQCGLFTQICPSNIELCDMIKNARYKLHALDKTPGAYRQYFMRDMAFANGEYAAIKKAPPRRETCQYAFFPGCNLGALSPEYVSRPYKWLLSKEPDTGLLLRCCSLPVDWNGEENRHREEMEGLKKDWEGLGRPVLIMACMSCQKHIEEYLPQVETISLYEMMASRGVDTGKMDGADQRAFSVFDPCSARGKKDVQAAVRSLARSSGLEIEDLPKGDAHGCCGFGGMGEIAAPDFTDFVAKKRSELSDNPFLVYCSNCRDIFTDRQKEAVHILDILFDIDKDHGRPQPDVSRRRANRVALKEELLRDIWGEEMKNKPEENKYRLILSDRVKEKINKLKVLEEDICAVIENAQRTGRRTLDPETDRYKAYKEIGHITFWVEYSPYGEEEDSFEIHNVYAHRMKIQLEPVWGGKKVEE